jgi:Spy/CpxP family protein refolding chaperone
LRHTRPTREPFNRRLVTGALLTLAVLALPALATAQDGGVAGARRGPGPGARGRGPSPERMLQRMEQRLEQMKTRLALTPAQERRIRRAMREGANRAREVLNRQPQPSPERRAALRQIRWDVSDRIHEALSCDQREQLRRLRREHRAQRGPRRGRRGRGRGRGPGPGGGGA